MCILEQRCVEILCKGMIVPDDFCHQLAMRLPP